MVFSCSKIKKSFGDNMILDDISFMIEDKEKVALIGVNGAGKTTMLKIVTGEILPDDGFMTTNATVGYLAQMTDTLSENNTIYEEMLTVFDYLIKMEKELRTIEKEMSQCEGLELEKLMEKYSRLSHKFEDNKGYEYKSRLRGVIKGLGFSDSEARQPVLELSGGQKTRVSLGKLLLRNPEFLLLDEPTNHLDIKSIEWLEDFLRNYQGSILLVSHDRYFINKIVTKVIEIENRQSTVYNGDYTHYASKKSADRDIKLRQYLNQQKEIKRQEEVIRTLRSFNREKFVKRAESREKMLDKMERVDRPASEPDKMRFHLRPRRESGNDVLFVEDVTKTFNVPLFQNISFEIKKGEKVALIGPNGIGKTTLFKIILDKMTCDSGKIRFGSNVIVGFYDQEQQELNADLTIFDEIAGSFPQLTNGVIRNALAAFVFTGDDVFKKIGQLSGGERGRVSLAKIMLSGANFLILDEPTNHLDIYSKEILEEAIRSYDGTVLYISHDRYFVNNTATKIIELTKTGVRAYLGNYDYYIEKKAEIYSRPKPPSKNDSKFSTVGGSQAERKADLFSLAGAEDIEENIAVELNSKEERQRRKEYESEQRRRLTMLNKTEEEIEAVEMEIEKLEWKLGLSEINTDPELTHEIFQKKQEAEEYLDKLYEKWGELS